MMPAFRAPLPAVLVAITMGAGWLLGIVAPFELPLSFSARLVAGGAVLALGVVIGSLALREMRRATPRPNRTPRPPRA